MEALVREHGQLAEEQAMLVVQLAKTRAICPFGGTANFLVAREFSALASYEQKLALMRCLVRAGGDRSDDFDRRGERRSTASRTSCGSIIRIRRAARRATRGTCPDFPASDGDAHALSSAAREPIDEQLTRRRCRPRRLKRFRNPCCRKYSAACWLRTPWWHWNTIGVSRSS